MKEKSAWCGRGSRSEAVKPGQGIGGKQHWYAGSHTTLAMMVYGKYTRSEWGGPLEVLQWARVAPIAKGGEEVRSKAVTPGLVGPDEGGPATPGPKGGCCVPEEVLGGAQVPPGTRAGCGEGSKAVTPGLGVVGAGGQGMSGCMLVGPAQWPRSLPGEPEW